MATIEELEKQIQALTDIEAIKCLKAAYMEACDNKYNPDQIAALFTEDCIWECNNEGCFHGKQEMKDYFIGVAKSIVWALHYAISPVIEVNGNEATGKWYLWMLITSAEKGACIYAGRYDDKYVKVDGKWLCKEVRVKLEFASKYEDGWAKGPWSAIQ